MEKFDLLEKKIRLAAEHISALRQERQKLLTELQLLEEENKRTKELLHENETLREQRNVAAHRIEKLLKRLSALKV